MVGTFGSSAPNPAAGELTALLRTPAAPSQETHSRSRPSASIFVPSVLAANEKSCARPFNQSQFKFVQVIDTCKRAAWRSKSGT